MNPTRIRIAAALLCAGTLTSASAATTFISSSFDDDPLGTPSAPWQVYGAGASTVSIVNAGAAHGHAMRLDGDAATGAFVIATAGFDTSLPRIDARFDVRPHAGASFIWSLTGPGSYSRVRLQLDPGSTTLIAQTSPSGDTACGRLPAGRWTRVSFSVDTTRTPHTFSVQLDGQATACTDIETNLGPPFGDVGVMDASNEGWGGRVLFDNFLVKGR